MPRNYAVSATVSFQGPSDTEEKTYGATIEVEGPATLSEFQNQLGEAGMLDVLVKAFKVEQAKILRDRIEEKIGKKQPGSGGRVAKAVHVDLS